MTSPIRRITPKKALLILFDISAALAAILLACLIYYSGVIPASIMNQIRDTWFLYLITAGFVFYFSGLYDQMWAFASGTAYISILIGVSFQMLIVVMLSQLLGKRMPLPVYILYWFLLTTAVSGIRLLYRLTRNSGVSLLPKSRSGEAGTGQIRVVIVGAVAGGQVRSRWMRQQVRVPVLCIDDNHRRTPIRTTAYCAGNRYAIPALANSIRLTRLS